MSVAAVAATVPLTAAQSTTEPVPAPAFLTPEQDLEQYLARLTTNLNQGPQPQRDEAALRLVEIDSDRTHDTILTALQKGDERTQAACARAIAEVPMADPRWAGPLRDMLDKDRAVDATAHALARYEGDAQAYEALIQHARNRQQASRKGIINALGRIVQKQVAEELLAIVNDSTEDPDTRIAAADSLLELSGKTAFGTDARRWQNWWDTHAAANPAEWRTQVLAEQHAMLERQDAAQAAELNRFKTAIGVQLAPQFDRMPPSDKLSSLLRLLKDNDANVREIGVDLVSRTIINAGQPVPEEIHRQLIDLVGDASRELRNQAVNVLGSLADRKALDALLVQLQIEPSAEVKTSILKAIALTGIDNPKAVAVIEQTLQDPSPAVAAEAARTLGALAGVIRADPARSKQVFDTLQKLMQDRTGPPGTPTTEPGLIELRAALVSAMSRLAADAPLESRDLFPQLLNLNELPEVRRAALQGLAALGPRYADQVARELDPGNEPDSHVREAAATALGQVGSFVDAVGQLDRSMRQQYEPEQNVRQAARRAFERLLPTASVTDLSSRADLYSRDTGVDRAKELVLAIRQELAKKLKGQDLAVEEQRIGDIALQLTPPRYDLAIESLRKALKYYEDARVQSSTVVVLVQELERSLLQSGQFREAVQFGSQEIARDQLFQDYIGPEIYNKVKDLVDKGRNGDPAGYKAASELISEATKMNPPLDAHRQDELRDLMPVGQ